MERLVRELVEPLLLGRAQRGVLDHQRSLERELLDELPLLVAPVPRRRGVAADHEAERRAPRPAAGRRRRTSAPAPRPAPGGSRRLAAAFSTKIGLACAGGDAPQAEVVRGRPATCSRSVRSKSPSAPTVFTCSIRSCVVAHQQRGLLGLERLLGHARERLAGLLDRDRARRPPGAAGGSRSRRAGASVRSALIRACSIVGRDVRRGRGHEPHVLGGEAVGLRVVDDQHADRARRAADRDGDQRLDPEGARPTSPRPAATPTLPVTTGSPESQRRLGGRQHGGGAAHQLPFGEIARAVRVPRGRAAPAGRPRPAARSPGARPTSARHALAERREHLVQRAGGERRPRSARAGTRPRRAGGRSRSRRTRGRPRRRRAGAGSAAPATRRAAAGSIESIPTALPASSGSKRAEPIARSAASSGGMRSSSCASAISAGRASSSTLTATGIWSSGISAHSPTRSVDARRASRRRRGSRPAAARRRATRSRAPLRRPRARPCRGGRPTRRPPAEIAASLSTEDPPAMASRHAPCTPRCRAPCAPRCYLPA